MTTPSPDDPPALPVALSLAPGLLEDLRSMLTDMDQESAALLRLRAAYPALPLPVLRGVVDDLARAARIGRRGPPPRHLLDALARPEVPPRAPPEG